MESIGMRYRGRVVVYEAKSDADKALVNELLAKRDFKALRKYIVQESEWESS